MTIVDFTAQGTTRELASAIEQLALERRAVTALVVPWESDAATLRMAVTASKGEGWAIEHTNLGTVSLADLGSERTRVVVTGEAGPDLSPVLISFARQIERRLGQPSEADRPGAGQ
jgi:hypothetical protein